VTVLIEKEGPEGSGGKTSKFGLKESKAQDKNNIISNRIEVSVLILDCSEGFCHFIGSQQYSQMSCVVEVTESPRRRVK
jgi:hypothetical protein